MFQTIFIFVENRNPFRIRDKYLRLYTAGILFECMNDFFTYFYFVNEPTEQLCPNSLADNIFIALNSEWDRIQLNELGRAGHDTRRHSSEWEPSQTVIDSDSRKEKHA